MNTSLQPQYSFVINSFNRKTLLEKALTSLIIFLENPLFSVVVYDCGSTDGSREILNGYTSNYTNFKCVTTSTPLSFSAGCNYAVQQMERLFPEVKYFTLFETDNFIYTSTPVFQAIEMLDTNPTIGAVGYTIKNYKGDFLIPGSTFLKNSVTILGLPIANFFNLERIRLKKWNETSSIRWHKYEVLYTSPLTIRLAAWNETGGMDEELFPFTESDTDWAYRLCKAGYTEIIIQTNDVIHDNLSVKSEWSSKRVMNQHLARLVYTKKHHSKLSFLLTKYLVALRHTIEILVTLFAGNQQKMQSRKTLLKMTIQFK